MKKWVLGTVAFIFVYLFFLVALVPAQWVVNQISLPKNVVVQGVKGSIWQASIHRIIIDGYAINKVNTQVNLLSLLMFNLSVDATFGGALESGPEGQATLSHLLGDIEVSDTQVLLPANDIAQLLQSTLPIPLTAQQFIHIDIDEFAVGDPICQQLNGNIEWDKASVNALDEKVVLGKLSGKLGCEKGLVKFTIDPKNNLGLTFTVLVYSPSRFSGNGFIKPGNQFPAPLKEALPFIGRPDNQGKYALNF